MLLHRYLESAAIKHDLTLNDACLLLALENPIPFTTKKGLANYAQLPLHILSLSLSHLSMRGFIQPLPIQHFSVCLLETATPVLDDLKAAINDFECTCMTRLYKRRELLYSSSQNGFTKMYQKVFADPNIDFFRHHVLIAVHGVFNYSISSVSMMNLTEPFMLSLLPLQVSYEISSEVRAFKRSRITVRFSSARSLILLIPSS